MNLRQYRLIDAMEPYQYQGVDDGVIDAAHSTIGCDFVP